MHDLHEILAETDAEVLDREANAFDRILSGFNGRMVIFGAGNLGRTILRSLRQTGIEPLAFSDNSQSLWNKDVEGIAVLSPADAAGRYGKDAAFFVCIWSLGHRYMDTRQQLEELGCKVFSASSIRWKFADSLLPFFSMDLPSRAVAQRERIRDAAKLWSDSDSLQRYLGHIRFRILGDWNQISQQDPEESYFVPGFTRLAQEVFVDCGAFDGVTIHAFLGHYGNRFRRAVAFEPDPANFAALTRAVGSMPPEIAAKVQVKNLAVSDYNGAMRFLALGDVTSCRSEDGDTAVTCSRLDDALEEPPTLIKMDIEGAEPEALEGARRVISSHRPVLAICVYHAQDHIWRIPQLIHELCPDYRLYLRQHEPDTWQAVCYAIPPEREVGD